MLEEAADDGDNADRLADPADTGFKTADAADIQLDRHAGLRGPIERLDALLVHERVHLHHDPCRLAGLMRSDGPLDLLDQRLAHPPGRHQHLLFARRMTVAGERVEQVRDLLTDATVDREESEVLVQPCVLGVEVAGPNHHVVTYAGALASDYEDRLGVRLEAWDPVYDVGADLLERARPADVQSLVEARLQLHQAHRLLALLGRLDQRRDQRGVVGGPVDGHLDRQHVGIVHRLLDEALHAGGERVVGIVNEDISGAHRREYVRLVFAIAGPRAERRMGQRRPRLLPKLVVPLHAFDLPQVREVEQALDAVHLYLVD